MKKAITTAETVERTPSDDPPRTQRSTCSMAVPRNNARVRGDEQYRSYYHEHARSDSPRTVIFRGARSPPSQAMSIEWSRAIAALGLLLFSASATALFNPFGVPVEIELAIPVVFAGWVGGLLCVQWYHRQNAARHTQSRRDDQ